MALLEDDMKAAFFITIGILIAVLCVIIFKKKKAKKAKELMESTMISFKEGMEWVDLPVIPCINNNKRFNLILDSGSNVSHINSGVLNEFDFNMLDTEMSVIGIEGNKKDSGKCIMKFNCRGSNLEEEFCITDLNAAFDDIKRNYGVSIHGILGNRFLEKYGYVLDFAELVAYRKESKKG